MLDVWLDFGADLGNHSHSHLNINNVPLQQYVDDIAKGEPVVKEALAARGRRLTYYRHPFLFTGPTPEIKQGMQAYLDGRGYRVAPVTLDNADYQYAALYTRPEYRERVRQEYVPYMESVVAFFEERSVEVVGREFPQILLIHANQLNADLMPDLLAMFRRRGYTFVSLEQALADPAYRLEDGYAGRNGFSWIHRWSRTKGMKPKGEPEPPEWVRGWPEASRGLVRGAGLQQSRVTTPVASGRQQPVLFSSRPASRRTLSTCDSVCVTAWRIVSTSGSRVSASR